MSNQNTKELIADVFHSRVQESSYSRIKITSLIDQCEISRTAFYYHFTSKLAIAIWIFRHDVASALHTLLPESKLVFAPLEGCPDMPYYVHDEIGAHALDASAFFKALCMSASKDWRFYKGLIAQGNREFLDGIYQLYLPAIRSDVNFVLGGRFAPEAMQSMLSSLVAKSAINMMEYAIAHPDEIDKLVQSEDKAFWNGPLEMLQIAIEHRPTRRNDWYPYNSR